MASSARIGDSWIGICCCHTSPTCVPMGGYIIGSSPNNKSGGPGQAKLMEQTIGWCGHPGFIVSSSFRSKVNSLGKARIGDTVVGCNLGIVVGGLFRHDIGN